MMDLKSPTAEMPPQVAETQHQKPETAVEERNMAFEIMMPPETHLVVRETHVCLSLPRKTLVSHHCTRRQSAIAATRCLSDLHALQLCSESVASVQGGVMARPFASRLHSGTHRVQNDLRAWNPINVCSNTGSLLFWPQDVVETPLAKSFFLRFVP